MKRVIAWLKNIRPAKVLTAFVASALLLLTQACNNPGIAAQPPQPSAQPPNAERYDPTKSYDLNTPSGGMNNFNDVDYRSENTQRAAEIRSKALRDNAQRNIDEKGIDSVDQYVENYRQGTPFGQRVKNLGEDIGSSAKELGEGVAKGTKRGVENLKDNTQNAGENAADAVKDTLR
ncbi:hypothetical protein H6G33_24270 [Calothrix sp. FACHB-1219]|uniref:hypothetical protein n=1 Tax=unclassified Calothrix TaxID=2619626 RepID=UPI000B5FAEB2|nr:MULTISPECIES: hypothetical protein [unclassified Calothrix]MBD2205461.1 hypothetical protein [Calothrix sp. FACHB-168]MBD2220123.1 hypothetical protein [Calothrix sp. FACHB-1219]BAY62090.1 hypothetical protein NIES22_21570 [Calothrix brevissima NIES-22]